MLKATVIVVCDDFDFNERTRNYFNAQGVGVQVYSTSEWESRATGAVPTLGLGSAPLDPNSNILPFPGAQVTGGTPHFEVSKIEELESKAIENAIFQFRGNLTEAARALGIGRATLYRKVKLYNLDPAEIKRRKVA